jgi:tetratricopeptide (TPR) repeat protein
MAKNNFNNKKAQFKKNLKTAQKNANDNHDVNVEFTNSDALNTNKLISTKSKLIWIFAILAITSLAYLPTFKNELTNWDDDKYVYKNTQTDLSWNGIKTMFTTVQYMGNYHPLTMVSLAIDYNMSEIKKATDSDQYDDVNPFWFHFTNHYLHLLSTLFLFFIALWIADQLKFKYKLEFAIITALLFGVHTLHVESITWVSERKDVLYVMFYMAALMSYIYYLKSNRFIYIIISFSLFVLSLLSKGQATSFAVTLIAVDYLWKRKINTKLIVEKIVFVLLALLFGLIAVKAQHEGQAVHAIAEYTLLERLMIASYGFTQYLWRLVIPVSLSAIYPYPYLKGEFPGYWWLSLITPVIVILLLILTIKKSRMVAFCIMFFVVNIGLLLQIIPVGSAIIADRYAYVPSVAFFLLIGFGYVLVLTKKPALKPALNITLAVYILGLSYLTFERTKVWKDSVTLWDDVIKKYKIAVIAYNNRGSAKKQKKDFVGAIDDFSKAIDMKPDYKHAIYNRGTAKKDLNDMQGAMKDFDMAILLDKDFSEAYHNRGITRDNLNDQKGAIEDYNEAIRLTPSDVKPYVNRGVAKGKMGDYTGAIADFNYCLSIEPENADAFSNRGLAKSFNGNYPEALADYDIAIRIRPDFADAYYNRALTKEKMEDLKGAIEDFTQNLQIKQHPLGFYFRGMAYQKLGNMKAACSDWKMALSMGYGKVQPFIDKYCK